MAALLPAAWIILVCSMLWVRHTDAVGPRALSPASEANLLSNLFREIAIGAIEVLFLIAILRPWIEGPIWPRATAAFVFFLPWVVFAFATGMHAGSMNSVHTIWRIDVALAIGAVAIVSALRSFRRRRRPIAEDGIP